MNVLLGGPILDRLEEYSPHIQWVRYENVGVNCLVGIFHISIERVAVNQVQKGLHLV